MAFEKWYAVVSNETEKKFVKTFAKLKDAKTEAEQLTQALLKPHHVVKIVGTCSAQKSPVKWEGDE